MKKQKIDWKEFQNTRFALFFIKIWKTLKLYFGLDDAIALIFLLVGLSYYLINGSIQSHPVWSDIYKNIHDELIGIGLTVIILGNANQHLRIKAQQSRLILQMGSLANGFALEAVRQLSNKGWLYDGKLKSAHLEGANLRRANLHGADLREADLARAILIETNLIEADLSGAILTEVDLRKAHLRDANLQKVPLFNANLKGADLRFANLQGALLLGADLRGADPEWG